MKKHNLSYLLSVLLLILSIVLFFYYLTIKQAAVGEPGYGNSKENEYIYYFILGLLFLSTIFGILPRIKVSTSSSIKSSPDKSTVSQEGNKSDITPEPVLNSLNQEPKMRDDKDVSSRYIDGIEKRLFKELLTPLGYKRDDSGFALRINSNWISIGFAFVTFDYGCKQIKSTFYAGIPWIKFIYSQIEYGDELLCHFSDIDPHNLFPVSTYHYSELGKYDSDFFMVCTDEEAEQVVAEVFRLFITDWHNRFVNFHTLEEFYKEVSRPYYFERYDLRSRGLRAYTWVLVLILARLVGEEEYVQCKGRLSDDRKNFPYYEKNILEMDQALEFLDTHTPSQLETLGHQLEEQYNEWKAREKKRKEDEQNLARLEKKKKRTEVDGAVKPMDRVVGFDPQGDPDVRMNEEGELEIVFEFMPPLNEDGEENEDPMFEQFDEVLSKALGVEVLWDDREFFRIPHPQSDTRAKAIAFLNGFWKKRKSLD